jgi:gamma-glutamylaminecyclotransferase
MSNRQDKHLVAVYGTLKSDESNHRLLSGSPNHQGEASDSVLIGSGTTHPNYDLLEMGAFPGAIYGNHRLMVEVYEVNNRVLARLDQLEGHPSFYERTLIPVELDNGEVVESWIYTISHLSSHYNSRPLCTNFDTQHRLNWTRKHDHNYW